MSSSTEGSLLTVQTPMAIAAIHAATKAIKKRMSVHQRFFAGMNSSGSCSFLQQEQQEPARRQQAGVSERVARGRRGRRFYARWPLCTEQSGPGQRAARLAHPFRRVKRREHPPRSRRLCAGTHPGRWIVQFRPLPN